jgi:hypothetical protein
MPDYGDFLSVIRLSLTSHIWLDHIKSLELVERSVASSAIEKKK